MRQSIHRTVLAVGILGLLLAAIPYSASAHRPTSAPSTHTQQAGPAFTFPSNGQSFPLNGNMLFQVQSMGGAKGYLWSFVQGGGIMYQNLAWEGNLDGTTYSIKQH